MLPQFCKLKKIYRWIRFRHGHGIHSPFAYSFINDVIEEENLFYGYKAIADKLRIRKETIALPGATFLKNNLFLFRLSNHYKAKRVIMVGCKSETSIFYLQGGNPTTSCALIEWNKRKLDTTSRLCEHEKNLLVYDCNPDETLKTYQSLIARNGAPDILYIHHASGDTIKQNLLESCCTFAEEQTIIVLDDIYKTKENTQFWKNATQDPRLSVSFDLIEFGILIKNKKLQKQHYKLFY